jgi:hypothetical protein
MKSEDLRASDEVKLETQRVHVDRENCPTSRYVVIVDRGLKRRDEDRRGRLGGVLKLGLSASGMRQRKAADSHGSKAKIATANSRKA